MALSEKTHQRIGWWFVFLGGGIYTFLISAAQGFYFGETVFPWVFLGVFVLIAAAVCTGDHLMESGRLSMRNAVSGILVLFGVLSLIAFYSVPAFAHTEFGKWFVNAPQWPLWSMSVFMLFAAVLSRWTIPADCAGPRRDGGDAPRQSDADAKVE